MCLRDIRLEYQDYVAQLDFVVISNKFICILETKKLNGDIEITRDGDFITFIPMIAQTSRERDIKAISQATKGFAYVLSRNGITGGEADIPANVLEFINSLKASLQIPRCVGFGIRTAEQVQTLAGVCDGVVVGSALVDRFARLDRDQEQLTEEEYNERELEIFNWIKNYQLLNQFLSPKISLS